MYKPISIRRTILFWTSALASAVLLLYILFPPAEPKNFEDFALGAQTKTVIGMFQGERVHCMKLEDMEDCLTHKDRRGLEKSVLWLGNSQLHAINQARKDHMPSSVYAAEKLRKENIDLITFSQPNASLTEHYILLEILNEITDFDALVLPAVFDDTREQSIRGWIKKNMHNDSFIQTLNRSQHGKLLLKEVEKDISTSTKTVQEISENLITKYIDQCCNWEKMRSFARGEVSLFIYKVRNFIFNINPNTTRSKIPNAYKKNINSLKEILKTVDREKMKIFIYIAPLRSDVEIPYNREEYEEFKLEVEFLAKKSGANFANLEELVEGSLWGMKESTNLKKDLEYDFMHYKVEGHKILADKIVQKISEVLDGL